MDYVNRQENGKPWERETKRKRATEELKASVPNV